MFFASDNWAGASDPIMNALARHTDGFEPAYGESSLCDSIETQFQTLFETDCSVFVVATGTAANALALSAVTGPAGTVFCHKDAHIRVDECGAPEFLTSGARMWGLDGKFGKLTPRALETGFQEVPQGVVHHGQPSAISLSQATEWGTIYDLSEINTLSALTHDKGLAVHMDGARFANAMVTLETTPAEMTWKSGVDLLSFGATKNGAWCAEAVVFFNKDYARDFIYRRKRAGHLFSKMRFVAAQFEGYFENNHWLDNARHANAMATKLAEGLDATSFCRTVCPTQANEVFAVIPKKLAEKAQSNGAVFHDWPSLGLDGKERLSEDEGLYRLVCSFRSTEAEIDRFLNEIGA
ncbi:low specificity L-threonine aldolase [uncultured Cohaesibacter sp.]|uniref:threonine aldolase family protein n=1 Tax=uncultured Cohaesibacter sp. TaxID=1002546 RepID=UPI00292EDBB0|nr:low specificity L-threonine aldolase [uncultured Cohaesibacter sp.]